MEYDPHTGKVELLGIPAPRETIYGGVYSPKDDAYYMLGWMRGHLYRYDCKNRTCRDLGQASEYRSYRIVLGPDQNVYFSTKSGFLMRYNVDLQRIENLHARIPCDKTEKGTCQPYTYMGPCVTGPDGRLYTTGNYTTLLSCYDIESGTIRTVGDLIPADSYIDMEDQHTFVAGMDFDKNGVLWYSTMAYRVMEDEHYKVPAGLFRWDLFRGGTPEFLGLFGTEERIQTYTDSFLIDKERDILYSVSTNHSFGSPDVIAIDLAKFRGSMYQKGNVCRDMLVYAPGDENYHAFAEHWQDIKIKIAKFAANLRAKSVTPVRLWDKFEDTDIANAAVRCLHFADEKTLEGLCGTDAIYRFVIRDGKLTELRLASQTEQALLSKPIPLPRDGMPGYPGRQWRSGITCECPWTEDSVLVGTEDGFLAKIFPDGRVFSLGPAICQGPVRDLCSNLSAGIAYGVGGDTEDIGNVFRYTDTEGLTYLGYVCSDRPDTEAGVCASFVLSACALSPDGKQLAIGACDRLSCIYLCDMDV